MTKLGRAVIAGLKENQSTWRYYKKLPCLKRLAMTVYLSTYAAPLFSVYYFVTRFFNKIKRIIEWLPILWKTEDWDYSYSTKIFAHSLKRLENNMVNGTGVVSKTKRRKIQSAIATLERISNTDKYVMPHIDNFYKRWGTPEYKFIKVEETENKPLDPYSELKDMSYERVTDEQKKVYDREYKRLHGIEDHQFNQDMDLLHKILKKHLRSWWD